VFPALASARPEAGVFSLVAQSENTGGALQLALEG